MSKRDDEDKRGEDENGSSPPASEAPGSSETKGSSKDSDSSDGTESDDNAEPAGSEKKDSSDKKSKGKKGKGKGKKSESKSTPKPQAAGPASKRAPTPQASIVTYKAALRKAIRKNEREPEHEELNITAMLDLMTIILVFLLQSMASSATAVQDSEDLTVARSAMTAEPSDQGVKLVISKSAIMLGEGSKPVLELPSREILAQQGIDARHKRSGPNDLYIVPLANRLENARKVDKKIREAMGKDASTSEAIIVADAETPYRLLIEVLFTLGQSEFGKYHLLVMREMRKK